MVIELLARARLNAIPPVESRGQGGMVVAVWLDDGGDRLKDIASLGQVVHGRGREQDTLLLDANVAHKENRQGARRSTGPVAEAQVLSASKAIRVPGTRRLRQAAEGLGVGSTETRFYRKKCREVPGIAPFRPGSSEGDVDAAA